MQDWTLILIVGVSEFVWSYLADHAIVKTVSRQKWQAAIYDMGALILTYTVLSLIARSDWNVCVITAAIIGASFGTFLVASRKPKRKKKVFRKMPVSTA